MLAACNVLILGEFYVDESIEIAIESFASFYHDLTSKHHKKLQLIIIEERTNSDRINSLIKRHDISNATNLVFTENQEAVEKNYNNASMLMFPSKKKGGMIISEALSYGIPILCYETDEMKAMLDHTCSMFVKARSTEDAVSKFAGLINMLYFDPEVRKILKKGALAKYKKDFTWGLRSTATR